MYYVATVANAYRTIMDKKINGTLTQDDIDYYKKVVNRVSNRENMPQFYNGLPLDKGQYYSGRQEISNQDFLGLVLSYDKKTHIATVEQRNKFSVGDTVEVFGPNTQVQKFKVEHLMDENENMIESANHAQETVKLAIPFDVENGDIIRVEIA